MSILVFVLYTFGVFLFFMPLHALGLVGLYLVCLLIYHEIFPAWAVLPALAGAGGLFVAV